MPRRQHLTLFVLLAFTALLGMTYLMSADDRAGSLNPNIRPDTPPQKSTSQSSVDGLDLPSSVLSGGSIAPKLGNATAKAELGRASWKLLHTMMARFPESPTEDDQLALKTYIQLFGRLYPCGECAEHFREMLKKYPPQTSSRNAAAGWACFVHNIVNERLKKDVFDCSKIGDFYDCGCGEEGKEGKKEGSSTAEGQVELAREA